MKKTLGYFFSTSFFLLFLISAYSQTERIKGLRIGVDLSRFALYYFEPERKCFQISADFEVIHDFYPIIEYGWQTIRFKQLNDSNKLIYNYNSEGTYYRIGADYNFLKIKAQNQYDMLFFGLRYGFASMSHSADNIAVNSGYWGNYTDGSVAKNSIKAYWIEIGMGLRAEIFKNFFMGWSFNGRIMIKKSKDIYMDPYNIPGYGNGSKKSAIGFNYSIYYRIPILKEKIKAALEIKEEIK